MSKDVRGSKVRNAFSPSKGMVHDFTYVDSKTGEIRPLPSLTRQADKESCDINNILSRFEKTGMLPDMIQNDPQYGDFSAVPDFMEACSVVAKAEEQFLALDAEVRAKFNHDPAAMLEFVANPANKEELYKLGLAVKPAEQVSSGMAAAPAAAAPVTPKA